MKILNTSFLLALILIIFTLPISVEGKSKKKSILKLSGQVLSCHDADTCRIKTQKKEIKVRFSGIDAPEAGQAEGKVSRDYLRSKLVNHSVDLECEGKSFDRNTCTVFLNGININEDLVKKGFAFDSPKYSKGRYAQAMNQAREAKVGVWKTLEVSPYCFRHKTSKKCLNNKLYLE